MTERLWNILVDSFPKMLEYGVKVTIPLTVLSFALAMVVALIVAMIQYAHVKGIRQICHYVSPEEARPGDIIFFEHTYDTAGASHVGIYVGNNMMIHCGEPVQYTSINGYWQDHFMQFGRLP